MYNITLKLLGERLKQIRDSLELSQTQMAEKVNCKQNAISNLERGKGGSITLLVNILNFYSSYVYIDFIFSNKFYLISNQDHEEAKKSNVSSIIVEIIKQAEKENQSKIKTALESANVDLQNNLQKAIDLLES